MNSVQLTGRLVRDPELRHPRTGTTVCELRLAVDGMGLRRSVGYVDVSVFGKPGEAAARVLGKGWLVAAYGLLAYREWDGPDGARRSAHRIIGNVEFLAAPRSNGRAPTGATTQPIAVEPDPDDIPF